MTGIEAAASERRVLVLAPFGKDAPLIQAMLAKYGDVESASCADLAGLLGELEQGAAAALIAEEALADGGDPLFAAIARQPPWSDLPVLLLTRPGADSPAVTRALETLGNVTLLERPVRVGALSSAVQTALRARERQYQTRAHLREREEIDRRKDEFLATLAHELRNPLAPIRNCVQILRLSGVNQSAGQLLEMMERQIGHMVRLVDDLLEVSRITRGTIELRKEHIELAAVVNAAVETSRPLLDSARHQLTIDLPADPVHLHADAVRLTQVFANLLNNAARYTDEGGRISIDARSEDDTVSVTISDTGAGISAEALPSVFDMFVQAHTGDGRAQSGLGIGLTLVRGLAEKHGGSVSASSEGAGKGSQFTVRLPLARTGEALATPKAPVAFEMKGLPRILVVDDNHDAADSLGALLQILGADARIVYDGRAALEEIAVFRPKAVLLDIGMAGMDGHEVARCIRQRADTHETTLIALTGWGQERDRVLSRDSGFDHHLIKPVDIGALQAVLTSLDKP